MKPTAKRYLQMWLGRIGLYERIKASWIYDAYWSVTDRQTVDDRCREIEFYRRLLEGFQKGNLIFDIGANHGYKTDMFLRLGARVVCVEPDETSQGILERSFLKYRLKRKPLHIVPAAVSDTNSSHRMWIDTPGGAKNTLSRKWADTLRLDEGRFGEKLTFGKWKEVETVTMESLIAEHGVPFFIKIDVEGHELSVLQGMRQPVPYLSFEVNLPEFRSEGLECVRLLGSLAKNSLFNYSADCRQGLLLEKWAEADVFLDVLDSCAHNSIEVFWKTRF